MEKERGITITSVPEKSNRLYTVLSLVICIIKRLFIKNKKPTEDIHFDVLNNEEFDY